VSFSPAPVLFERPYSVIDGTPISHEGTYYLFHKEEEFGALRGERRAISLATASAPEGPYTVHDGPLSRNESICGQIVPVITEGPAITRDPQSDGWLLLYDFCMGNDYGISSSPDLWHWREETDVAFPANARHGSVITVTTQELARLQKPFPLA
jgi:hypothetical protein